ncbi:MAG: right-handed parallel beta-helix repeat-containing protein [Calditrichaeota bacterium]|nr:right-handed parallel beta-helix repeat-containing protein [Calditrichota bacterium]
MCNRLIKTIYLTIFCILAVVPAIAQNVYFISPDGSDAASGSIGSPWRSINFATQNTQPGDTIYMRGGNYVYDEVWIKPGWGGANGLYKTLAAYPGETPVMLSQITVNCSYLRVEGLFFQLPKSIRVVDWDSPSLHVHLMNNHFTGPQPRYGAIEFRGSYGLIEGNTIEISGDNGESQDHGIYVMSGENNTIRKNTVSGTFGYGIHLYDELKSNDDPNVLKYIRNVVVEENIVKNSRKRSGMIVGRQHNVRVENVIIRKNIFAGNNHVGLLIRQVDGLIEIVNNTFYNNGLQALNLGEGSADPVVPSAKIINNIFYTTGNNCREHCDWFSEYLVDVSSGVGQIEVNRNLYLPLSDGIRGAEDVSPVSAEPMFSNPANDNFSLKAESPAIDAGIQIGLPFHSVAPDLGAIEFSENDDDANAQNPQGFNLEQNHPNPFNLKTAINYQIFEPGKVKISIFDMSGQEITTLVNEPKNEGFYTAFWDGKNANGDTLPSGIYFYQLKLAAETAAVSHSEKKMVLIK